MILLGECRGANDLVGERRGVNGLVGECRGGNDLVFPENDPYREQYMRCLIVSLWCSGDKGNKGSVISCNHGALMAGRGERHKKVASL